MKTENTLHIGTKIKERFDQTGLTVTAFAEKINKERSNIYDIFKRASIDTDLLIKISEVLQYDFFQCFSNTKESKEETSIEKKLKKAKIVIEVELSNDEILKLGLSEKVLKILNN